jgi:hypothetical protein
MTLFYILIGIAFALEILAWIRVARWFDQHAPRHNRCKIRPTVVRDIASGYPPELLPWVARKVSAPTQESIP